MGDYYFDIETTELNPYEHIILTIQLKIGDDIILWKLWEEENEVSMILKFMKYLKEVSYNDTIYGYNCLKFDVPFIWARLNIHGIMDSEKYRILYEKKWKDLYQYLGGNYIPIDKWLHLFRIERQCPFTGRDIPSLYQDKRFKEIEHHAKDDLIVCEKLVEKLNDNKELPLINSFPPISITSH